MSENSKSMRNILGQVVSNKMDKTIAVDVVRKVLHPLYKKYIKRTSRFYAHDPEKQCQIGDTVMITQCRPMSKKKHWMLVEVVTEKTA